jgi:hypothetical protein
MAVLRVADLIRRERAACARIAERWSKLDSDLERRRNVVAASIAQEIRARNRKPKKGQR